MVLSGQLYLPRHHHGAPCDDKRAVEVPDVVDAVLVLAVELAPYRSVALHVAVDLDLDHYAEHEEAAVDALLQ